MVGNETITPTRGPCVRDGGAPPAAFVQGVLRPFGAPWCAVNTKPREDFALQSWVPGSWDNRHIVSFTGGKKWDSGWEVGAQVLFSGGLPYTPYALDQSLLIENWETFNAPIPDWGVEHRTQRRFHKSTASIAMVLRWLPTCLPTCKTSRQRRRLTRPARCRTRPSDRPPHPVHQQPRVLRSAIHFDRHGRHSSGLGMIVEL